MSETVEQLLDAAENAIRLRGYHAVSFRDLADDIGIKSASVHYHFPQKDDLGVALVERYSERVLAELERRAARAKTSEDKLRAFFGVYRDALVSADRICLCVMLGAESRGLPVRVSEAVTEFFEANIAWIAAALDSGLSTKARRARASAILAALQGGMLLATALKDHAVFDGIVSELRSAHTQR